MGGISLMNDIYKLIINSKNNFNFNLDDIDKYCTTPESWKKFVREKEVEQIFSIFSGTKFEKTIEFGAGEGIQTVVIVDYSKEHTCSYYSDNIDENHGNLKIDSSLKSVVYMQNDIQCMPEFKNESFDLIYTSNTLEHIINIDDALSECCRILKNEAIMIHIIPNRLWKISSFVLNTIRFRPPLHVHGISNNHISELYFFGKTPWVNKFNSAGLEVVKIISMPFYNGTQNKFKFINRLGNKYNLSSSFAYILKKKI